MATSSRSVANDVRNVLDFLQESDLALYVNAVDERPDRVTFHRHDPTAEFLINHNHPDIDQYRRWVQVGAYSAVLPDASLLQLTYDIAGGEISGHPAAHMTINGMDCRVACVAPVHPLRFIDFVFRHFYPAMWLSQPGFFEAAPYRHFGKSVLADEDRKGLHLMWDVHAKGNT